MTKVKICGISDGEHALAAARAGANFIGMVFAPSRRQVTLDEAVPLVNAIHHLSPCPAIVGVFVNFEAKAVTRIADALKLDWVQFSGKETWQYCRDINWPLIKVIHVAGQSSDDIVTEIEQGYKIMENREFICLLDTSNNNAYGGTGQTFDWGLAKEITARFPVIIAGGLTPENVGRLIREAHPWGVDVSTGVETNGRKDTAGISAFIEAVRRTDRAITPVSDGTSPKDE